jgi:hypothetical protein
MKLHELKTGLNARPNLNVALVLPDGRHVPAHYHVTEVGQITKQFIDCGGTIRRSETCVLQTYFGSPRDDGHRLTAAKLAHILELARPVLASGELPVEVEYEDGVISQFPLVDLTEAGGNLVLQLGLKHTDCLAKDKCGIADDDNEEADGCCSSAPAGGRCCS